MCKIGMALFLVAPLGVGTAIGSGALTGAAAEPVAAQSDRSWIDQRVQQWQTTEEERRFDEIGWAKDLPEARRLARENNRPLFVFTYSGSATEPNAIALRRC